MAAICWLLKRRSPLLHSSPSWLKVFPRERPRGSKPSDAGRTAGRRICPTNVLHGHEGQPVVLAVHRQLDSDPEIRDGGNHPRERNWPLRQRSALRTARQHEEYLGLAPP